MLHIFLVFYVYSYTNVLPFGKLSLGKKRKLLLQSLAKIITNSVFYYANEIEFMRFTSTYFQNRRGPSKQFLCDDVGGKYNVCVEWINKTNINLFILILIQFILKGLISSFVIPFKIMDII
jgi:hypothetical protein